MNNFINYSSFPFKDHKFEKETKSTDRLQYSEILWILKIFQNRVPNVN